MQRRLTVTLTETVQEKPQPVFCILLDKWFIPAVLGFHQFHPPQLVHNTLGLILG